MKRALAILILFMFIPVVAIYGGHRWLHLWGQQSRGLAAPVSIELRRGEGLKEFSLELADKGIVEHPLLFQAWTRLFSKYQSFQAGRYLVPTRYTVRSLTASIIGGETHNPVVLQFTIPEGFTIGQIAARLAAQGLGSRESIEALCSDVEFIASLGVSAATLEGYLYPATYSFTEKPTAREALAKMVRTFWDKLPDGYEVAISERGLSLQQAITFASLIELETHHDDERALVSEVIWNRLNKGIALAIDAAIIYGIEDYAGDIKRRHLEDATNPYNTRKHRGLPPGPIGSPSKSSLEAVLTPSSFGYYYYVLDMKSGKHNFSKSLSEHNRYVQKMLRDRRALRQQQKSQ